MSGQRALRVDLAAKDLPYALSLWCVGRSQIGEKGECKIAVSERRVGDGGLTS